MASPTVSEAQPGQIGEYMTMTGTATGLANNVMALVASLDLTAGDWDVSGNVHQQRRHGLTSGYYVGIDDLDTYVVATFPTSAIVQDSRQPRAVTISRRVRR